MENYKLAKDCLFTQNKTKQELSKKIYCVSVSVNNSYSSLVNGCMIKCINCLHIYTAKSK